MSWGLTVMINFSMPNLPDESENAICAENSGLLNKFKNIVLTRKIPALPESMQFHADLQLCHVDRGTFVSAPECYDYYKKILGVYGCNVLKGEKYIGGTYGSDCAYNVLVIGKKAFHNTKYTDNVIKKYFEDNQIELIHVNQGYTKCAASPLCENKLISADPSILRMCKNHGIDCLEIPWNGVLLSGFSHGFFGGSSGRINKEEFYICGNLNTHPASLEIDAFVKGCGMRVVYEKGDITDFGSVMVI